MKNIFEQLTKLLKKDERLVSSDDNLLKNQVQELARKNDPELIRLLLSDKSIKQHFFFKVDDVLIFDKEKFIRFVSNKQFLPDSYTSFKNKIGLTVSDEYLSENKEVVLVWPYKDCVLEGGMTKEDQSRDEIFYNEILAPDDINRLLDSKVFTNFKRIDKNGEHRLDRFKRDEKRTIKDNLVIKGNNLLALASLKKEFAGKVKLIYIDPPYNTGNDSFLYNDSFNHSTWLTFIKNRLIIARDLLADNGSIYVQMDYNEVHYLKILLDEIFGRQNLQREIIWNKGNMFGYAASTDNFVLSHDSILFYTKSSKKIFNKIFESYSDEYIKQRFVHDDKDGKGRYRLQGKDQKQYLSESKGVPMSDIWEVPVVNVMAKEKVFDTQKPEALIKRIIEASSNEGDIILDFMSGGGTTGTVAHKLKRQFILCEQMENQVEIAEKRLKRTIDGEIAGISKDINWQGGGDFVFMELAKWNEGWIEKIEKVKTSKELIKIWVEMKETAFLSYKIEPKIIDANAKGFGDLSIDNQKKFLIECLDKNQLYVNYSEIDDKEYRISKEDKELNKKFYEL